MGASQGRPDRDLQSAFAGDGRALERLVRSYRPVLEHWVLRWTRGGWRGLHDAEDVVQEALVSAVRALGEVRDPSPRSFRSWLRRIVQNRLRDVVRRRERTAAPLALEGAIGPGDPGLFAEGAKDQAGVALVDLGAMGEDERLVLVLRDVLGTTWRVTSLLVDGPTERVVRRRYGKARTSYVRRAERVRVLGRRAGVEGGLRGTP